MSKRTSTRATEPGGAEARYRPRATEPGGAEARYRSRATEPGAPEARYRPLYARVLGLRHLHPGGMLCFVYFEGAIALSLLLALAELVSWWVVLILPVSIALMVKVNDLVAGAVARSAARTPDLERERLRREVIAFMPTVGHAPVAARRGNEVAALTEATAQYANLAPASGPREGASQLPDSAGVGTDANECLTEATAQYAVVPRPDEDVAAGTVGRQDMAGRYTAAGRYLDAAWRQHAYAMAHHTEHADPTTQRERQSASRRYE
jgi:predicted secreted protein